MTDFLGRLARRAMQMEPIIQPLFGSRYAPADIPAVLAPGESAFAESVESGVVDGAGLFAATAAAPVRRRSPAASYAERSSAPTERAIVHSSREERPPSREDDDSG